jgi:xylitol oxidase
MSAMVDPPPAQAPRTNWAGNYRYTARRFLSPGSVAELQDLVRAASKLRVLGSRHSFNDLADTTGDLVTLAALPRKIDIDREARTVTVDGVTRYGDLCVELDRAGFALHNLASLPHVSVAGACSTSTHGSGDRNRSLSTAVSSLMLVTADGELQRFARGDDAFPAVAVALGGAGPIVELTLDVEPAYVIRQDVYESLPRETAVVNFDAVMSAADSVSLFTEWRSAVFEQVWLKRRVTGLKGMSHVSDSFFGAHRALEPRHPIRGQSPSACTPQLGIPGPWHERLPHFRFEATPSAGNELQSEYQVPRERAADALLALDALREQIAPLVQISEVRSIAQDDLWLSPSCSRASVAIHFTWLPDWDRVQGVLPSIEHALEPFAPRPHWGKLFSIPAADIRARYPMMPAFADVLRRLDPGRKFRNAFLDRYVFGEGQTPEASA